MSSQPPATVQIRLLASSRANLAAVVAELVQQLGDRLTFDRLPDRPGRKGDWLLYASIVIESKKLD